MLNPAIRQPATQAFLARLPGKLTDTCRAELEWAQIDWRRRSPDVFHDARTMGPHPLEASRLPHEHAAATVLTVWGHLHPVEARAIECGVRLAAQRKAGPAWVERAAGTEADLRRYLADRTRLRASFDAAAATYLAERAAIDMPAAA
jgi:hypothetical protein